jgi:protein tyrosine phosphatase (PTP) superfamily phosphohydrolase (DUF442 family)
MKRREFLLTGSLGFAGAALVAVPQTAKKYVCPPCGCELDDHPQDEPGNCVVCGMRLVDVKAVNELGGIPNFAKVNDQVWTGGQPTMEHLIKLKEEGVKVIINLRDHSESGNLGVMEAANVRQLGLVYFNIPVLFRDLRPEVADEFLRVTDQQLKQDRVFIHCAVNVRVAGFWMIRRVLPGWMGL